MKKSWNYDEAFKCFENSQLNLKYENFNLRSFKITFILTENLDNKNLLWKQFIRENEFSPVFLIGFPRSGTTLLDTILRSHPEIDVVEEKPLINSVEQVIKSKFKYSLDELHKLNKKI